jgi:beta-galactosidase
MHVLSTVASLAHGADAMMYFQWRKSRGSTEKLHGAVIDHDNSPENRVFMDVAQVGRLLEDLQEIRHSRTHAQVAVLFDTESHWALESAEGFSRQSKKYPQTVHAHYKAFWDANISVDVITPDKCARDGLARYKAVVVPMLYMMGEGMMEALRKYVYGGGVLVSTYITGLADENDLMYLGGFHPVLREVFGISVTETDTLYPSQRNAVMYRDARYEAVDYCAVFDTCGAEVLGTYASDFYAGGAAVTRNAFGKGMAYFIGARTGGGFLDRFYRDHIYEPLLPARPVIEAPPGVSVQARTGAGKTYYFVMNFTEEEQAITLSVDMHDLVTGRDIKKGRQPMPVYGVHVLY